MLFTDDHRVISSFKEYLEWWFFDQKRCYENVLTRVKDFEDRRMLNWDVYSTPWAQYVHQTDTTGLSTNEVLNSAVPVFDIKIDYKRGRLLTDNVGFYTTASLQLRAGAKKINLYLTSNPLKEVGIFERFHFDKVLGKEPGLDPYGFHLPALFINLAETRNDLWAAGGTEKTTWVISVLSVTRNERDMVAVCSMLRDLKRKCLPVLNASQFPLNEYGELKGSSYTYKPYLVNPSVVCAIEQVIFRRIEADRFIKGNSSALMGLHDFTITWIGRDT